MSVRLAVAVELPISRAVETLIHFELAVTLSLYRSCKDPNLFTTPITNYQQIKAILSKQNSDQLLVNINNNNVNYDVNTTATDTTVITIIQKKM